MEAVKQRAASSPSSRILHLIWMRRTLKQQALQVLDENLNAILPTLSKYGEREDWRDFIDRRIGDLPIDKVADFLKAFAQSAVYVTRVIDGDTLEADGHAQSIRLANVRAPELHMPEGQAARRALANLIDRKWVSVQVVARDQWGRAVSWVRANGQSVNNEMDAWLFDR